jgi:PST family polysaccharide transporter/lipopolysaccharide exporter
LRTLRLTSLIAFPSAIGIAVVAPEFILVLFGEEWEPAVPAMQVLAFYGLFRAIGRTFSPLWKTIGRPDVITKLSAIRLVLLAIFIYPLTSEFGIVGTAITVTGVFIFPMMPLDIIVTSRLADIPVRDIVYEFVFPSIGSVAMGLGVLHVSQVFPFGPVLELVTLVVVGIVLYAASVLLLEIPFQWTVRDQFATIIQKLSV